MTKRVTVGAALGLVLVAVVGFGWRRGLGRGVAVSGLRVRESGREPTGTACVVATARWSAKRLACADVALFPGVLHAIGVDDAGIVRVIDGNDLDGRGFDRSTGRPLAPGYPVFSRLSLAALDNVYVQGDELTALLEESTRASARSGDPEVRRSLSLLSQLAEQARTEGHVLRVYQ